MVTVCLKQKAGEKSQDRHYEMDGIKMETHKMRHLHKEHYHIFFMVVNLSKVFFSSLFLVCSYRKQTDAILVDYESVWLVVSTEQSERCPYLFDIPSAEELVVI